MLKSKLFSNPLSLFLLLLCFHIISSQTTKKGDTLSDVLSALKEIAFSYYMRGKNIQYCSARNSFYPPEEATSQKINYVVCSKIVDNIYKELLNITTPNITEQYINYAYHRKNRPEIVLHTSIRNTSEIKVTFDFTKNRTYKINPTYEDIVPYLQPGDILIHFWNRTGSKKGHTMMVYDVYNNTKDAIIMESTDNIVMVNTKMQTFEIYLSKNNNTFQNTTIEEGTIQFRKLSEIDEWKNMNQKYYYTILRFIQGDENKIARLYYDSNNKITDAFQNEEQITLFPNAKDRLKFSHLYIEKTVDKHNNNYVQIGDKLIYKIRIKNWGESDYQQDIKVLEMLDKKVEFKENLANKTIPFRNNTKKTAVQWTLGKLKKGEEIILEYSVEVKSGKTGDVIISTGKVENIPSSTVKNTIGNILDKNKQNHLKDIYDKLKSNYTSINLINEIYKEAFNIDIGLYELNLTDLVINHNESDLNQKPSLNRAKNNFSKIVFTNHYSAIANLPNETEYPVFYKLKYYRDYNSPGRRQDFIYPDLFQTGDILIYTNYFDYNYKYNFSYTYETGEYAYIYIDGKFVGNNPGLDENINRRDEFTAQYYKENNLTLLKGDYDKNDSKWLELANLQTLFAKNYYVILRPSLDYNFTIQCEAGKFLNDKGLCQICLPGQISSKGALKCEKCPAGTLGAKNGTICLQCPLGFYSGEGWNYCLHCIDKDYYDKDNRQCTKCPENYYLEEVTYECKKCPNGTLSKMGSFYASSCKKCPLGQYFSYSDGWCLFCPDGTIAGSNPNECINCPAGTYSYNSSFCKPCPTGKYSPEKSKKCFICPRGSSPNANSSDCILCEPGTFSKEGYPQCRKCEKGTYSYKGAHECFECPAGQYLSNGECLNCDPGTFSSSRSTECTLCNAGTYSEEAWGYCKKCSAGFYSSDKGASFCNKCQAGTVSGEGFSKCIPCPAGFYSSQDGANSCRVCPSGTYSDVGAKGCSDCPKGKKSEPGSAKCY